MAEHDPISEEKYRKMISDSYEKAGVDLPLVTLETVLDRDISANDARQTGAPRFRKFLNKAMIHRKPTTDEQEDDLELQAEDEATSSAPSELPIPADDEHPSMEVDEEEEEEEVPQPIVDIVPEPTEGVSADHGCPTFDFCCPKNANNESVASDKYIMSNMQLPEGFDDECAASSLQEPPALLDDIEDSMVDTTMSKSMHSTTKGSNGLYAYAKGSRRFRYAMMVCCLLHVVLIGLIIAFVTNMDKEPVLSSSSAIGSNPNANESSPTLVPEPEKVPVEEPMEEVPVEEPMAEVVEVPVEEPVEVPVEEVTDVEQTDDEEDTESEIVEPVATGAPTDLSTNDDEVCADQLELSLDCMDPGADFLIYFDSCTPQAGDWVAIFEASANPEILEDDDAIAWLYTCGDRVCAQPVEQDVLSFARATDRAGEGTYRAHLLRNGEGPVFSAVASSPPFRVVNDAANTC